MITEFLQNNIQMIQAGIAVIFLMVLSIIDIKTFNKHDGIIPAMITTCFIIFMLIPNPQQAIIYGVFGALISLLLVDIDFFKGIADVKVLTAVAMTFNNLYSFVIFVIIMLACSIGVQILIKKFAKKLKYMPLIPVIFFLYCIYALRVAGAI